MNVKTIMKLGWFLLNELIPSVTIQLTETEIELLYIFFFVHLPAR